VNHKDGDRTNNDVSNIEWMTPKENTHHAIETGLRNNKGINHYLSKLTEKDVIFIKKSNLKQVELSKIFGVSPSTIWRHVHA